MDAPEQARDWRADPYARAYPESAPFWEASAAGVFMLPQCTACGRYHWYPRAQCPLCNIPAPRWVHASGQGSVFSCSVVRAATPYVLAYVQLDEGPLMLTNIVDCDPEAVRIGQRVAVGFSAAPEGRRMPVFHLLPRSKGE